MARQAYPDIKEGARSVSPEIPTIQVADEFRPAVENFFAQIPEVDEGPDRMAAFDAAVAVKGLAAHSLEHKQLMWQREVLARLDVRSKVSIYDGLGPLYGTLMEAPIPTGDPLQYKLRVLDSQTGEETVRTVALSSVEITEE